VLVLRISYGMHAFSAFAPPSFQICLRNGWISELDLSADDVQLGGCNKLKKWGTLLRFLEVTSARCWLIVIGGRALGLLMNAGNTVLPAGDTSGARLGHTGRRETHSIRTGMRLARCKRCEVHAPSNASSRKDTVVTPVQYSIPHASVVSCYFIVIWCNDTPREPWVIQTIRG